MFGIHQFYLTLASPSGNAHMEPLFFSPFSMVEFLRELVKISSMSQPFDRLLPIPSLTLADQIYDRPPDFLTRPAEEAVLSGLKKSVGFPSSAT